MDAEQNTAATVPLGKAEGVGTWPQLARDARNTSYAPGASGPRDEVGVAWTALGDRSYFPPVVDGDLYLTENWTSGGAISLESARGTENWHNRSLPPIRWAPALHDGRMLVVTRTKSNDVRLHALDAATGDERWAQAVTASSSSRPATGPTVTDERIYIGSSTGVLALDATTGDIDWKVELGDHIIDHPGGPRSKTIWATPAVTDDRVYTFDRNDSYGERREVYALDRESGEHEWTAQLDLGDGWSLDGHVVAGNDRVFVLALRARTVVLAGSDDPDWDGTQRVFALDATSGTVDWHLELDGKVLGPPAYAEGVLFVGEWHPDANSGALHAVDVVGPSISWTYKTDAGGIGTPAVTPDAVYIRQGRELTAVTTENGDPDWRLSLGDDLSDPIVADDTVYALAGSGRDRDSHLVAVRAH